MIVRKTLLLIISLVFVASMVQAKGLRMSADSLYLIPKTTVAPVIDGVQDNVWKILDWNFQRLYTVDNTPPAEGGYQTLFGMHKAMYDDNNLYILFYTQTNNIVDIPANANWNQDAVEIYIDADNSKTPSPKAADDVQITIPHSLKDIEANHAAYIGWPGATLDSTGIEFKIADEENNPGLGGWYVEVKIPLANLNLDPKAGTKIGWEMQQDKSIDGTQRNNMSKWWNATNNSWNDASIWGTAQLTDRVIDTTKGYEINKVPNGLISIDGKPDAIYGLVNSTTVNAYRVGDPPSGTSAAEPTDLGVAFLTTYMAYDETNLYALFDVVDQEIIDIPANANWNQDAVEFYIDADNSKTPSPKAADDVQVTMPHFSMGTEAGRIAYIGWPGATLDSTGVEYKITDKDDGTGWYAELKIPLERVNLSATEGTVIGLEFQKDEAIAADNNQRGSMEKWWSASNNSWNDASLWGTGYLGKAVNVTDVKEKPASQVKTFALGQNYPNPFNPATTINFSLPQAGFATIKVYNMLGQEVATLLNREIKAGSFEVNFDASKLTSGVYFYTLTSGKTTLTKKMMLLK